MHISDGHNKRKNTYYAKNVLRMTIDTSPFTDDKINFGGMESGTR
jgi:hypothetical protein